MNIRRNAVGALPVKIILIIVIAIAAIFAIVKFTGKGKGASPAASIEKRISSPPKATEPTMRFASILPSETVAYYSTADIEDIFNQIESSSFVQKIKQLNVFKQINAQDITNALKELEKNIGLEINKDRIMEIIGQEIAIAVLPPNGSAKQTPVVFLFKTNDSSKIVDTITTLIKKAETEGSAKISKEQHNGAEIVTIASPNPQDPVVKYILTDNTVIFAVADTSGICEKILDLKAGNGGVSLADNASFKEALALANINANVKARIYIDMKSIAQFIENVNLPPAASGQPITKGLSDSLGMLNFISASASLEDDVLIRVFVSPNEESANEITKALWSADPKESKALSYIPKGSLIFTTATSIDIQKMWNNWTSSLKKQNPTQADIVINAISQVENTLGFTLKNDIFPWIGEEISFCFESVDTTGIFPLPKLALLINTKNSRKAADFMDKMIAVINTKVTKNASKEGGMPFQLNTVDSTYEGLKITSIQIPFLGEGLMPSYAVAGDYLIISSSADLLKRMVDTSKGKTDNISTDPFYKASFKGLPSTYNQQGYVNVYSFLDSAINVCRWVVSFTGLRAGQNQPNTSVIINDTVIPMLDSLKVIKSVGTVTVYTKKGLEQNIKISLKE